MQRINQHEFYRMGMLVHPLTEVKEGSNLIQIAWTLNAARNWIIWILSGRLVQLTVSRTAAETLVDSITSLIPENTSDFSSIDPQRILTWLEAYRIHSSLSEFETVFGAELPTLDTYIVSKKGIYSTADLIERAENAIDADARAALSSDAISDFKQAGKCLAFELPTAAGFHTMRSVEAVLRVYWRRVLTPSPTVKPPEMAKCINELRSRGEDATLMEVLDHIRDLHRNTVMHPEAFLTMTEAQRLFDIAKSAISAMGDRINVLAALDTPTLSSGASHLALGSVVSVPIPEVSEATVTPESI